MKVTGHSIITAVLLSCALTANHQSAKTDSFRQLPTRISTQETPADITIAAFPRRIAGIGDFNGDRIDDFLVEYTKVIGGESQTIVLEKFGIVFGKRDRPARAKLDLTTEEPDLALATSIKPPLGTSSLAQLGDLNGDGIDDLVVT